ncbi:TM2 domain protein [Dictyocaulus viviparus]|uniref:TM2 domain protein n=1 Tax=Dictyocaulus viviparus TaxID=29172 RepID=A0A0D8Y0A9_DICVI|nr:TM2 domain protein [Dictyocaulus viviparus]
MILALVFACIGILEGNSNRARASLMMSGRRTGGHAHCSRIDCEMDASCLHCTFPVDCELDEEVEVNCTSVKECGPSQISVKRNAYCRYCWQSDPSDYDCLPQSNCSTTSWQLVPTECSVHPNVICKGRRVFNKRIRCNWSSGISWAKTMFLSVTLGGFGADRFYLGLWKSAIGKLFSFGGLGIWTMVDVVLIAIGYIRPADGSLYI